VNLLEFSELTIVHSRAVIVAEHVPVLEYPATGLSVAVHVAPAVNPVTVNTAGSVSDAFNDDLSGEPVVHDKLTSTLAALSGEKSFFTVKGVEFTVLTIVHSPAVIVAEHVPELEYPAGTAVSVAVHELEPGSPYPLTVNVAGSASDAFVSTAVTVGVGEPEHTRPTVTSPAALFGTKSLPTVKACDFTVFTIVQPLLPPSSFSISTSPELESDPVHCPPPLAVYPLGIGFSVAVHVAPSANPVTVNTAGFDSEAFSGDLSGVPDVQERLTSTCAELFGTKSFFTVKLAEVGVVGSLVNVHFGVRCAGSPSAGPSTMVAELVFVVSLPGVQEIWVTFQPVTASSLTVYVAPGVRFGQVWVPLSWRSTSGLTVPCGPASVKWNFWVEPPGLPVIFFSTVIDPETSVFVIMQPPSLSFALHDPPPLAL
jgi:hypothetical protein